MEKWADLKESIEKNKVAYMKGWFKNHPFIFCREQNVQNYQ